MFWQSSTQKSPQNTHTLKHLHSQIGVKCLLLRLCIRKSCHNLSIQTSCVRERSQNACFFTLVLRNHREMRCLRDLRPRNHRHFDIIAFGNSGKKRVFNDLTFGTPPKMQHFRDDRESSMPALAMEFRFDAGMLVSMPIGMPEVVAPVPGGMPRTFGVPTRVSTLDGAVLLPEGLNAKGEQDKPDRVTAPQRTQSGHCVAQEPASQTLSRESLLLETLDFKCLFIDVL